MTLDHRGGEDRRQGDYRGGRRATDVAAARVSAEMYRRRMTARHLAKRAGVDDRTVRNVLDGKDAKLTTLEAIAEALGVPLIALITDHAA